MKHSLKIKYTLLMLLVLAAITAILFLFVNFGLEPYAVRNKQNDVRNAVAAVLKFVDTYSDDNSEHQLNRLAATDNLGIGIYYVGTIWPTQLYTSNYNLDTVASRFKSYMNGETVMAEEILEQTDDFVLYRIFDNRMSGDQIECMGLYKNHAYFITTSLAGVHESVVIFSRFLLLVCLFSSLIGVILNYFLSRKLAGPIIRLANLSAQISNLDFSGNYGGSEKNEIGILGQNMNIMSDRLEKTINDLRSANIQLGKDIERMNRVDMNRRELIANISHELKTPIALIQGFSEGLKEGVADGDKENMDYYCDVIIDEAAKMNSMVRALLELDEIESGNADPEYSEFDINELVSGVIQNSKLLLKDKQVKIELDAPESILVSAPEYLIEGAFTNYFSNACHYVSDPGVITISTRLTDRGTVRVSVHNTGMQIPEEALPRIWDKFYKTDKARTRAYGGSGIGLSIVKSTMEKLHGSCGVNNTPDGVEFWFEIRALRTQ